MAVITPPLERSLQQRRQSLDRANEVRLARAQLKRDLAGRRVSLSKVLLDPPEWLLDAKVVYLLGLVPRFGETKAVKLLNRHAVSLSRRVRGLTPRQRGAILEELAAFERRSQR